MLIILRKGTEKRITLPITIDEYIKSAPVALFTIYYCAGFTAYYFLRIRIYTRKVNYGY